MLKRALVAVGLVAATFGVNAGVGPAPPVDAQVPGCSFVFDYTGEIVGPIPVPDGVTQIELDIFGASGGDASGGRGFGGLGAGVTGGILAVTPGDELTVIVGGEGGAAESGAQLLTGGDGGFGWDGGTGAIDDSGGDGGDATQAHAGGGGGGASAVLLNGALLAAAGGGGGGSHGGDGGDGGIVGADGEAVGSTTDPDQIGLGATATAGGAGGTTDPADDGVGDGTAGGPGVGGVGGEAVDTSGGQPGTSRPQGDAGGGGGGGQFGGGGAAGGVAASDGGGAGGGGGSTTNNIPGATPEDGSQDGDGYIEITFAQDECPGDLQIEKTVDDPAPEIGDTVTYTLTATNNGPVDPDTGVTVTDSIPDGVTFVSDDCEVGTTNANATDPWTWTIGELPIDTPVSCAITVTVDQPGSWTNTATITGDNPDADPDNNQDSADIDVPLPDYDLEIQKDAVLDEASRQITYTLTTTNLGPDPAQGAVVADVIPAGTTYVSDTCDGTVVTGTPPPPLPEVEGTFLIWQVGDMPVDEVFTCTVVVQADGPGTFTNTTAVATHDSFDVEPDLDNNVDDAEVVVPEIRALEITKVAAPADEVLPGDTVTYTVTVENTGEFTYTDADPAFFDDDLTEVLDDATFDAGSATADIGTATFTEPTLHWEGPLAPGEVATIEYSVTVDDPDEGDALLTNTVVGPPDESNCVEGTEPGCTTTVPVRMLEIEKTLDAADVVPGQVVTYTVTVTNTGQVAYTADDPAFFDDDMTPVLDDATFDDGSATATVGTATFTEPTLHWEGPLAIGQTATITYSVTVNDPLSGDGELTNGVVGPPESNCDTGTEDECSTSVPERSLEIAKTSTPESVAPGEVVSYTITVTNNGTFTYTDADPATASDDLDGVLDDATYNGDAAADLGTVTFADPTLSWEGPLAPGETATITFSVTVDDPVTGDLVLTNAVVGPTSGESNCDEGTEAECTTDTPVRMLSIQKTRTPAVPVFVFAGDTVTYSITVTNNGRYAYTDADPATFDDDLTGVLDDAVFDDDATATAGTATFTSPVLHWEGPLAPGESATITYSVTTNDPPTGDGVMPNVVAGPPESNCGPDDGIDPDSPGACVALAFVRQVEIVKEASATDARPGDVVTYTITLRNLTLAPFLNLTATDDLTGTLDDAVYNDDAVAVNGDGTEVGTLTVDGTMLTWTGGPVPPALAPEGLPGGTVTITYSVTVNDPISGDGVLENTVVGPPQSTCPDPPDDPPNPDCSADVPIRQLLIDKVSSPGEVGPGGTVTYTVTVENTGGFAYTDDDPAAITDDMTGVLDDATYNGDAAADIGTVDDTGLPTLSWSGPLAPGEVATITYSATVNDPLTGDGAMINDVTGPAEGNCSCSTNTPVVPDPAEPAGPGGPGGPGGRLPFTGSSLTNGLLVVGAVLVAAGLLLVPASRRLRRRPQHMRTT